MSRQTKGQSLFCYRRLTFEPLEARHLLSVTTLMPVRIEETGIAVVESLRDSTTAVSERLSHVAHDYALAHRADLGLSAASDFAVRSEFVGMDGLAHVRLDQLLDGVKVWGADIVVHLAPEDGHVLFLSGNVLPTVGQAPPDIFVSSMRQAQPDLLTATDAIDIGKAEYVSWALSGSLPSAGRDGEGGSPVNTLTPALSQGERELAFERESAELVVYPSASGPALTWHVEFFTDQQAGLDPGLWNFFIDAQSGQIVDSFDGLAYLSQASGPGGNPKVGSRPWANALDVEETGTPGVYTMDTARQVTTNMGNGTVGTGTIVTGPLDPIGDAAINDAHGFTEITLDMLQDWFGYDSIDDAGFKIGSRAHYGVNFANGFWDGTQVSFGDGNATIHPFSGALDMVGHEIHHGFTSKHSGLQAIGAPGALNESFSDIAGTLAEFYWEGLAADFLIAEDIRITSPGYIRSMSDPSVDNASIDDTIIFSPTFDVHTTNGIGNKAFVRTALRFSSGSPTGTPTVDGVRRAGAAWFLANESYWTSSTDYTQGGQGVYDAAEALGYTTEELLAIRDSWADVGVFFEGSNRSIDELFTTASGTVTSPNYPADYPHKYKHTWAIDPPGPTSATLTFTSFNVSNGDYVEIRNEAGLLLSRATQTAMPLPHTSTRLIVTFGTGRLGTASGFSASWTSPTIAPGDYDVDGNVDQDDYTFWRAHFGDTSGPGLTADGNENLVVDAADYIVWRKNLPPPGAGADESRVESQEPRAGMSTVTVQQPVALPGVDGMRGQETRAQLVRLKPDVRVDVSVTAREQALLTVGLRSSPNLTAFDDPVSHVRRGDQDTTALADDTRWHNIDAALQLLGL